MSEATQQRGGAIDSEGGLGRLIRESLGAGRAGAVVIAPDDSVSGRPGRLAAIQGRVADWVRDEGERLILISSAAVYGPDYGSVEYVTEDAVKRPAIRNSESDWWIEVEATALEAAGNRKSDVLVLRPPVFIGGKGRFFGRFGKARIGFPSYGFDPSLQVMGVESLVEAVQVAFQKNLTGTYNVAPADAAPLSKIMRYLGIACVPVPRTLQLVLRPLLLRRIDGVATVDQAQFLRYPNTISGEKFAKATGFSASTCEALQVLKKDRSPESIEPFPGSDPFGYDDTFRKARGAGVNRFLEKVFWRVERKGILNIPAEGPVILAGPHRGFMPLDAVMLLHLVTKYAGRLPRFLIHPTLAKFPAQARFFRRLGGIMACEKNGDWVLDQGGILGVFPEGIRGTFKLYKDAYKLERFGRTDYIRWSLKYRAPIVPFVIVGSAEIYPIFFRIKSSWFSRHMEWPFLPITPTFPIPGFPLPTKWHVHFLPALDPEVMKAEAAEAGESTEKHIARRVRESIDAATEVMREKRRSVFWGSVFGEEKDRGEDQSDTVLPETFANNQIP